MAGFLGGLVKNALSNVYSSGVSGFTRLNINQFNNNITKQYFKTEKEVDLLNCQDKGQPIKLHFVRLSYLHSRPIC